MNKIDYSVAFSNSYDDVSDWNKIWYLRQIALASLCLGGSGQKVIVHAWSVIPAQLPASIPQGEKEGASIREKKRQLVSLQGTSLRQQNKLV